MRDDEDDTFADDLDDLLARAGGVPHGPGKVALLEEAVALADARSGDDELAFAVRQHLLWPAYHGSRPDLVLVHYAWCLAFLDRHPAYPRFQTLWQYRWVVDTMPNFSQMARAQVEAASADMHDRYKADGWSLRPVWLNRRRIAAKMGDAAAAADAHRRYVRTRRDPMSDGPGQDAAFAIDYSEFKRDDKRTVDLARAHLADPDSDGHDIIHAAEDSALAFLRRREYAECAANVSRALRLLPRNREFLGSAHQLLVALVVMNDLPAALRLFDKNFAPGVTEPGDLGHADTYKSGLFLARTLSDAGRNRLTLRVPAGFVPGLPGERVHPGQLRDHLEAALPELCARADARNGNSYHTDRLADLDEFAALAAAFRRSQS